MHGDTLAGDVEPLHGDPLDDIYAEFGGAAAQGAVHHRIRHHVSEGLAGLHLSVETEEDRAHGIGRARIRDDHLRHRLRFRLDLTPAAELREHPAGRGRDRRGASVAFPGTLGRRVDDGYRQVRSCRLDADRRRHAHIAGTGYQHIE